MAQIERPSLGRLPPKAFGVLPDPPVPDAVLEGFRSLPDLTGMTSDALDELGLEGAIAGRVLKPTDPTARIVGRAITVRNVPRRESPQLAVATGKSLLADVEAHNLAQPGDVLVLEGVDGVSNMGGILASIGLRQGELGAVVDGAVRDVSHSREIGYPIWSRGVSPITGKWRVETVAVNGPVTICGVSVQPGDVVVADEVGVCFVSQHRVKEVLARALAIAESEAARQLAIKHGAPIAEIMQTARRPPVA